MDDRHSMAFTWDNCVICCKGQADPDDLHFNCSVIFYYPIEWYELVDDASWSTTIPQPGAPGGL